MKKISRERDRNCKYHENEKISKICLRISNKTNFRIMLEIKPGQISNTDKLDSPSLLCFDDCNSAIIFLDSKFSARKIDTWDFNASIWELSTFTLWKHDKKLFINIRHKCFKNTVQNYFSKQLCTWLDCPTHIFRNLAM